MGMLMGKISEEMPAFTVLHKAVSYEVRKYGPSVVAECSYGPGGWEASDGGSPFGALARYIGVFGKAQNEQKGASEAIAMTAPVLVTPPASQKIAMTAPVLVTSCQLVENGPAWWRHNPLPRSPGTSAAVRPGWLLYPLRRSTSAAQAPEAVRTFTWSFKPEAAKTQLQLLLADLAKDEWTVVMRDGGEAVEWQAAR